MLKTACRTDSTPSTRAFPAFFQLKFEANHPNSVKIELKSLFNFIKENSIICLDDGIYISGAQNTFVLNNVITDCKNGVKLFGSPENSLVAKTTGLKVLNPRPWV